MCFSGLSDSTKNQTCITLNIGRDSRLIEEVEANNLLSLQIDNNVNYVECIISHYALA
jgi:hypothetical protein